MNVRAPSYAIVNASALCPECGKFTHVIALCLPPHHEVLNVPGSSDDVAAAPDQAIFADEESWQSIPVPAAVFQIDAMIEPVRMRIAAVSPHFRPAANAADPCRGWVNHCEHCDAEQADYDLHCEPEGAFGPTHGSTPRRFTVLEIAEPFAAAVAGYSLDPGLV